MTARVVNHGRMREPYRICFVCSGNICRSPMAEVVLRRMADDAGLGHLVDVDSAGTGDWHVGERADGRATTALAARGYDGSGHRARVFEPGWFAGRDLVVALDRGHERILRSWAPSAAARDKVRLLRSFDPSAVAVGGPLPRGGELDVRDPYYDGPKAFEDALDQVEHACAGLLDHVRAAIAVA